MNRVASSSVIGRLGGVNFPRPCLASCPAASAVFAVRVNLSLSASLHIPAVEAFIAKNDSISSRHRYSCGHVVRGKKKMVSARSRFRLLFAAQRIRCAVVGVGIVDKSEGSSRIRPGIIAHREPTLSPQVSVPSASIRCGIPSRGRSRPGCIIASAACIWSRTVLPRSETS